jgi:uncharacterized Zn finger protein (UPF0148 family)
MVLEKAAANLHCFFCGDTLFGEIPGRYFCYGCNKRFEIVLGFLGNKTSKNMIEIRFKEINVSDDENLLKSFVSAQT